MVLKYLYLSVLFIAVCAPHRSEASEAKVGKDALSKSVFSKGETVFPNLNNYCKNAADSEDNYIYSLPYNTEFANVGIWGYAQGFLRGCGEAKQTFEGNFADLSTVNSKGNTSICRGTLILTQTQSKLVATWKIGENYSGETKCGQSIGEIFTLTLSPKTLDQLTTKSLSLYEYELISRPSSWEKISGKFVLKIIASRGVPGVDFIRDRKRNITFKTGSLLQSFTCDRGGADFPETGVCYRLNHIGEAWGSVLEVSEATPDFHSTRNARLNRADLKLLPLPDLER